MTICQSLPRRVYKAFNMDVNDDSIYESDKFMGEVNSLIEALLEA